MSRIPPLVDNRVIRPTQTALALGLVSKMDLLRLKAIARLYAKGLPPDVSWDDLLQESFTHILVGTRRRPEGVKMTAFVARIMLTLRCGHRRRTRKLSQEGLLSAGQELAAIKRLFTDDRLALQILPGLAAGWPPEQIRAAAGISRTAYDSARKRMRNRLLRAGLTCERD